LSRLIPTGFFCRESLRGLATDVHADGWVAALAGIIKIAANPASGGNFFRIDGGLPDFGGSEMRTIRIGIANALNDAEIPRIIERFEPGKARIESKRVVDF